ncbi:class I SAM-dependent methyltransferase [Synechococcus sp. CS-1324]|uniref:class I SAM-dependent methyltransferase n=1 Tax=Synechococcus sp. CS-1324 TaxID=2847980 RepID=UPI000DB47910|nr:class I SAM-dependent methyltransferase [Synechococcus sp. CS-1324]MCT0229483.1 class I SAM-dependent methyltransferase [Synechococcus sp. CS-1324]PZV04867.1 MAG: hypothetical protein DCF23_04960 [Cyanobium sp.]
MMDVDLSYVQRLLRDRVITGKVLELGGGYGGQICAELIKEAGLDYASTDLPGCPYKVDLEIDFLASAPLAVAEQFNTLLILNVLEHVFDPVTLLDRAVSLLAPQGVVVLLSPVCWPIHHYPVDCHRLLPDFYREYARRRGMKIVDRSFVYVSSGAAIPPEAPSNEALPRIQAGSAVQRLWSRSVHRLLRTDGRPIYTLPVAQEAIAVALRSA